MSDRTQALRQMHDAMHVVNRARRDCDVCHVLGALTEAQLDAADLRVDNARLNGIVLDLQHRNDLLRDERDAALAQLDHHGLLPLAGR